MGNALRTDDLYSPYQHGTVPAPRPPKYCRLKTGLGDIEITTSVPPTAGLIEAIERLQELDGLPAGWDTYSGRPVAREAFRPAVELIIESLQRCRPPRITATSPGGLALIWEEGARELEVEVHPQGSLSLYFADEETGEEIEPEGAVSTSDVREMLKKICAA